MEETGRREGRRGRWRGGKGVTLTHVGGERGECLQRRRTIKRGEREAEGENLK